jgi:hypothetical protein
MSDFTVGHLKELIQGLDDDIGIEVNHESDYYSIDNGILLWNQGKDNETLLRFTLLVEEDKDEHS